MGASKFLEIDARGGNGGRGGDGGYGHDGSPGNDGSDATSCSSGSDGGPGGDGGNGGNATNGANGGNGGFVRIIIAEEDMDLLLFLGKISIAGGQGGSAGKNGKGGDGGRGGRGGSSYSWTTTSSYTTTDSDGNSTTYTDTHYHSNPGGSDGPSGSKGRDGNALVVCGQDGKDGSYEFIVESKIQGPIRYSEKFDIQMLDFHWIFSEDDGVIEPGEQGFVTEVTLYNNGGMPTPIH
jgi:hypothetical protein